MSPASVFRAKYNWYSPIGNFIVSDDKEVDESDDDTEFCGNALLLNSTSDKENHPCDTIASGPDVFLKPGTVQYTPLSSSDLDLRAICLFLYECHYSYIWLTSDCLLKFSSYVRYIVIVSSLFL